MKPPPFFRLGLVLTWVLGLALLAAPAAEPAPPTESLRSIQEVQEMTAATARLGLSVQVEGVVLFHDAEASLLVLASEDGRAQILVETGAGDLSVAPGQRVGVEGTTGFFLGNVAVTEARVRLRTGTRPLTPKLVDLEEVVEGKHNYRHVEFEAVVTTLRNVRGRGMLHVHGCGAQVNVAIRDLDAKDPSLSAYQDAFIRVRGVVVPYRRGDDSPQNYRLVASQRSEIEILEPAPEDAFGITATRVEELPPFTTCCRIRVQGRVVSTASAHTLTLEDGTGKMPVQLRIPAEVRPGDFVEVVGYPTVEGKQQTLEHSLARLLAYPLARAEAATNAPASTPLRVPVLRSIPEVLQLSPGEASGGLPVRLQGQVSYRRPGGRLFYLRSGHLGIEARLPEGAADLAGGLRPGQIIEVTAHTRSGEFNPGLAVTHLQIQGEGSLPPAGDFRYGALASGQRDGEWVGLGGVVRATRLEGESVALDVATAGGRFTALVGMETNATALLDLVDAVVYARGICQVIANPRRQAIGFRLLVSQPADLTVQTPPPADPFGQPLQQTAALFRYNPDVIPGHRVRLRGEGTLQRRAESFWIRDETGGIGVTLPQPEVVEPGEVLEVVGFPSLLANRPWVHDALIRRVAKTNPPTPLLLSAREALERNHTADWISLRGRVVEVLDKHEAPTLVIESGGRIFHNLYPATNPPAAFRRVQQGDTVRVSGICLVKLDEAGVPRSFQLLGDSPAHVEILGRASWLNPQRALTATLCLLGVILAAAAWVILLRRQVRKQTRVILDLNTNLERRVAERTSELETANRELESFSYSVSHDLRGPLRAVNGFAEILLQTHGNQLDERGSRYLRQVAEGGRRMGRLVDDLLTFSRLGRQPVNQAPVDLHLLTSRTVEELRRQQPQRPIEVRLQPLPPALGDRALLEQVLINLIGNAWKFTAGQPAPVIEIGTMTRAGVPVYFVRDNGAGFDMRYAGKLFGVFQRLHAEQDFPGTGVGLAIVQRIIQRHGGHIWAEASPGQGATFFFSLPTRTTAAAARPAAPAHEPVQAFGK